MSTQTEQVLAAFQRGERVTLGSMSGQAFVKLIDELSEALRRERLKSVNAV